MDAGAYRHSTSLGFLPGATEMGLVPGHKNQDWNTQGWTQTRTTALNPQPSTFDLIPAPLAHRFIPFTSTLFFFALP